MKRRTRISLYAAFLSLLPLLILLPLVSAQSNQPAGFVTNTPLPTLEVEVTESASASPQTIQATPAPIVNPEDIVITPQLGEPTVLVLPPECDYIEGELTSAACVEYIEQHPEPDIEEILRDSYTMGQYSFWRVGPQAVTYFDAPGGTPIGTIPEGFNFVNVVEDIEGWILSETGQWIAKTDAYYVVPSEFLGVLLPDDWNLPFGIVLDTTGIYASLYPGGESTSESGLIPLHHERFNIYAEAVDAEGWTWYLVGENQWVKQIYMSVIKPVERPEDVTGRWVAVDLFEQSLVAYDGNRPIYATLISTGLPGTETNRGIFEVWARLDRDAMSGATGAPNAYALQSVPWVQYFDDSISLHGTYWHDLFGYRRSRGCVNLSISDARWVYEFFAQATPNTLTGDTVHYVYVHSSDEYR